MELTKDVQAVKQEIQSSFTLPTLTVSNASECSLAKTKVVECRKEQKAAEQKFKEKILNASEASYKSAKATFDQHKKVLAELLQPFKEWDQATTRSILMWETRERERVRKEQEKENQKYAQRVEKAMEKGKDPEAVKPPKLVQAPVKTAKAEEGGFTTKVVKKPHVYDESKVPEEFWIRSLDMPSIEAALRAGREVPGAVLREELQSSVRVA